MQPSYEMALLIAPLFFWLVWRWGPALLTIVALAQLARGDGVTALVAFLCASVLQAIKSPLVFCWIITRRRRSC